MNLFDKIVESVNPVQGLRRQAARKQLEILNSGYSNYGASHMKKAIRGWMYGGGSSKEDIEDNLDTLRQRCRDLYMGAPLATGAIKTYRTSVIGAGLSLKPKVDAAGLGISEDEAKQLEQQISREWESWADSTDCDASRLSNYYELQQLVFLNWLLSGDVLVLMPVWHRRGSVYDLKIQLVEADRCYTPPEKEGPESRVVEGVETNRRGEVVAYYIYNNHPLSFRKNGEPNQYVRVAAYGQRTGRRNVLQIWNRERIGQVRGVPMLAPVIEELKQLGRYTESELAAAVVSSLITVFIEKEADKTGLPLGESIPEEMQVDRADGTTIELGSGAVIDLAEGEKANTVTPGRPNANFNDFVDAICRQIGSALELPYELLMKQFTASYSASRGALLEAWKTFDMYKDWMVSGFCEPIYKEWLTEAVAKGRISAPGYFEDETIRRCYSGSEWYGASRGQLDPKKEVEAAELRVENGFSTGTKEAMELTGTDYIGNLAQRKEEVRLMQELTPAKELQREQKQGEEEGGEET